MQKQRDDNDFYNCEHCNQEFYYTKTIWICERCGGYAEYCDECHEEGDYDDTGEWIPYEPDVMCHCPNCNKPLGLLTYD